MKYHTYRSELDALFQTCEKYNLSFDHFLDRTDQLSQAQLGLTYQETLDAKIHIAEHDWRRTGRNMLIIDNSETVEKLLALKYKTNRAAKLAMPFNAFSLAIPSNVKFNGIRLAPALVNANMGNDQEILNDFLSTYSERNYPQPNASKPIKKLLLAIPEKIGEKTGRKNIIIVTEQQLIELLDVPLDDVNTAMEVIGQADNAASMSNQEVQQVVLTVRLIISIAIYNSSTNGKYLRAGVPQNLKLKSIGIAKEEYRALTKNTFMLPEKKKGKVGETVVESYMRNLQHIKYYQNENSVFERGTRWIEVSGWVTGESNPSTQSAE